jgi:hypothetical protein
VASLSEGARVLVLLSATEAVLPVRRAWSIAAILLWYFVARDLGPSLSSGGIFGAGFPASLPEGSDEAATVVFQGAQSFAAELLALRIPMLVFGAAFVIFWRYFSPHRWFCGRWSPLP